MRHDTASLLLAAGVPVETVTMILGHASPAVTPRCTPTSSMRPRGVGMAAAAALVVQTAVHSPGSRGRRNTGCLEGE
jgi:hypothetical protein